MKKHEYKAISLGIIFWSSLWFMAAYIQPEHPLIATIGNFLSGMSVSALLCT